MTLVGELDKLTSDAVRAELERAVGGDRVLVDLSSVTFLDSAGLHVLFHAARAVTRDGGRLGVVVPPGSPVKRVLEITHVAGVAEVCETVEQGEATLRGVSSPASGGSRGDEPRHR